MIRTIIDNARQLFARGAFLAKNKTIQELAVVRHMGQRRTTFMLLRKVCERRNGW